MAVAQQVFTRLGAPYLEGIWGTDIYQGLHVVLPLANTTEGFPGQLPDFYTLPVRTWWLGIVQPAPAAPSPGPATIHCLVGV